MKFVGGASERADWGIVFFFFFGCRVRVSAIDLPPESMSRLLNLLGNIGVGEL